jgi:hypothetical protein
MNTELVWSRAFLCFDAHLQLPRILTVKEIAILPLACDMPTDNEFDHWLLIEGVATDVTILTGDDTDVFVSDPTDQGQLQTPDPVGHSL